MSWQHEFGDEFDVPHQIDALLLDQSWHNDVCPHFALDLPTGEELSVWVDHPESSQRECQGKRFFAELIRTIRTTDVDDVRQLCEREEREELYNGDELGELLDVLKGYGVEWGKSTR